MMANESSKLLRFTLAILSPLPQEGLGQRGTPFQDASEGLNGIMREWFDGHLLLSGQHHQYLIARLQPDFFPDLGRDDHLAFG